MVVAHDVMLYIELLRGDACCHCFDSRKMCLGCALF
jgi:hypothetical protein